MATGELEGRHSFSVYRGRKRMIVSKGFREREREREGHWPPNRRLASAFLACHRRPTTSRQDLREKHRLADASRDYASL